MKKCTKCGQTKTLDQFYKFARSKDGRQHTCKDCMKTAYQKCRKAKYKHYRAVQLARERRNYDHLTKWKATQRCKDCGENNPIVLDLHHRDHTKKDIEVSNAVRGWSWKRLKTEIDKCDVLCANCHRIEHHKQKQLVGVV